jgi:glycosyltransferase involved in cell wall biosynthesis
MSGILFDARVLRSGMTGIGNYARSLLRALPTGTTTIGILLPVGSPFAGDFPGCRVHFTSVGITAHPRTEFYEQFVIPLLCHRCGYDSFVSFEGRVPAFHPGLRVYAFIYDMAFQKFPGTHNLKYSTLLRFSQWVAKSFATGMVTISETVRGEIMSTLGVPRERILLAYPGDSGLDTIAPELVPGVRKPFILAVSMTNRRKNLGNLIKAFQILCVTVPDLQLVVTGDREMIDTELRKEDRSGTAGILNAGFVSEGGLRFLYENAQALVYPSLDEGFGIPLLDAAHFGCPVACSNIPVFHEVLGENALYFDPGDPASIAHAMAITRRASARDDLPRPHRYFSWEQTARELLAVLESR